MATFPAHWAICKVRIGVICEGPTDFPAIVCYVGHALESRNVEAQFIPLFPELDKTRPVGGWGNVLLWLDNHPPEYRIARFFGGGLFGGGLATTPFDVVLIHLDADVIEDRSFQVYVHDKYNYRVRVETAPSKRAATIEEIISISAKIADLTDADKEKHKIAVATESTETWCIASFYGQPKRYELWRGSKLRDGFMAALERSEGRVPKTEYAEIDKNPIRRKNSAELILPVQRES